MKWLKTQLFLFYQYHQWTKWANARVAEAKKQKNLEYEKCLSMNCDKCRCEAISDCE